MRCGSYGEGWCGRFHLGEGADAAPKRRGVHAEGGRLRPGLAHAASMRGLVPGRVSVVGWGSPPGLGRQLPQPPNIIGDAPPCRRYIGLPRRGTSSEALQAAPLGEVAEGVRANVPPVPTVRVDAQCRRANPRTG